MMEQWVYLNDRYVREEDAKVAIEDRGFQFGDGLYEVARVYHGQIFALDAHIARMRQGASEIELDFPWTDQQLADILTEIVERNGLEDGIVYWQLTRGACPRLHTFPADVPPTFVAYSREWKTNAKHWEQGVKVSIQPDKRWLMCNVKTVNLLANVLAKEAAKRVGAVEALLEREGIGVVEGSSANLFIVKDGQVKTPPLSNLILPGITRSIVVELINKLGLDYQACYFSKQELLEADEVFITSTSVEVMPVVEVDEHIIANHQPGPITKQLLAEFRSLIFIPHQ